MTSILKSIARALRDNLNDTQVHVHSGATGRAYACHDPRCTSPRLSPERDG